MSPLQGHLSIEQLMSKGLCEPAHPKSEHAAGRGVLSTHLRGRVETAPSLTPPHQPPYPPHPLPSTATWRVSCSGQGLMPFNPLHFAPRNIQPHLIIATAAASV